VFCCPRLQRAIRVQQYHLQSQPDAPLGRQHLAAKDRRLPQFRTGVREPLNRMSSVDDSTASDQQVRVPSAIPILGLQPRQFQHDDRQYCSMPRRCDYLQPLSGQ
jgi:hypothetical protein